MTFRLPTLVLFLMSAAVLCAGCYRQNLSRLDRRVAELIRQEQAAWLDPSLEHDPAPIPELHVPLDGRPSSASDAEASVAGAREDSGTLGDGRAGGSGDGQVDGLTSAAMDLSAILAYAVRYAPEYRNEKESLFLSAISFLSEQHLWGPRFFSTFSADYSSSPEWGDTDQAVSLVQDLRITQRLPYGGEIAASALVRYVDALRSQSGSATDTQSGDVTVSVTLPLLRGAGEAARDSLVNAERQLLYAVRSFERARRQFLVDIASDFYSLLQQGVNIDNQERQLEVLEGQERRYQALAEAGRVAFFEVQRFQTEVLFSRSNLEDLTESYATAVDRFKLRIGMPVDERLELVPSAVQVPDAALDPANAVQAALANRLDLRNSEDTVEDARRSVRIARNGLLPDMDVSAGLTLPTDSDRQFGGFSLEPEDGSFSAGMTLDLPLDRQREWLDYRSALVRAEQRERGYRVERDQVALDVRSSIRQVERDRFNLEHQRRNVHLAERRLVEVELKARTLGPEQVISATEDLLDAQNRLEEATRNYRQDKLRFLLATGQMRVSADGQWLAPATLELLEPVTPDVVPDEALPAKETPESPETLENARPPLSDE